LDADARSWWDSAKLTGAPVLPTATTGMDRRPAVENPLPWEPNQQAGVGIDLFYAAPTPQEWGAHLQAATDWVNANSNACPANAIITYAWNELVEGGWLLPTHAEQYAR